jgi:hypothetical protein
VEKIEMNNDLGNLYWLNMEIGKAENGGNREWLASILAPSFAFLRADGVVVDGGAYLKKVESGGDRKTHIIEPIELYHGDRAIVKCIVTSGGKKFHNIRLFMRQDDSWKILGWANKEEMKEDKEM